MSHQNKKESVQRPLKPLTTMDDFHGARELRVVLILLLSLAFVFSLMLFCYNHCRYMRTTPPSSLEAGLRVRVEERELDT